MIEIGAGETTKISLKALQMNKNEGNSYKFHTIEQYPRDDVKKIQNENRSFRILQKLSFQPDNGQKPVFGWRLSKC